MALNNGNLKFTVKVINVDSVHFIVPQLRLLSDSQEVQLYSELTYGNEGDPIVDCKFYLQKAIQMQLVNMYVTKSYYPDYNDRKLREFTTKDFLTDSIKIEDFINLEPGEYVVYLSLKYFLNGSSEMIMSEPTSFFIYSKRFPKD